MNRREFLRHSAAALAATSALSMPRRRAMAATGKLGANEKFQVGFIGVGGRARQHLTHEGLEEHARVVAMADCWIKRMEETAARVPNGGTFTRYQDYRKMIEKEKLDAVWVCTPTHSRALICIHAMQAGLDVYAEKPVALTIAEGRSLVKATRKYKRVLQVGTQQRSIPINVFASRLVREGAFGKVREVIACNFLAPAAWEPKPGQPVPEGLDWDAWLNQTEWRDYHPDLHLKWPIWRDFDGGGQSWGVTGWGTHALDQVQCALGTDDTGPVEMWVEEPGPQGRVTMRYANGTLLKLHGKQRKYEDLGAIFVCENGKIDIQRGHVETDRPDLLKDAPPDTKAPAPGETREHIANFFECVRSRKLPNADIEIGHRSTSLCCLVNICRELGRRLRWDPKAETFIDDDEANQQIARPRRKGYELPSEFA